MPVSKTETDIDITPIGQEETLTPEEKMTVEKAEKRMKNYQNRGISFIQCPQCGTIHKGHNLAGLVSCHAYFQTPKGWSRCIWERPKTDDELHRQEDLIQRQIKRAIEGRSKKSDLFFIK